jgi:hypothetical protein
VAARRLPERIDRWRRKPTKQAKVPVVASSEDRMLLVHDRT